MMFCFDFCPMRTNSYKLKSVIFPLGKFSERRWFYLYLICTKWAVSINALTQPVLLSIENFVVKLGPSLCSYATTELSPISPESILFTLYFWTSCALTTLTDRSMIKMLSSFFIAFVCFYSFLGARDRSSWKTIVWGGRAWSIYSRMGDAFKSKQKKSKDLPNQVIRLSSSNHTNRFGGSLDFFRRFSLVYADAWSWCQLK